VVWSRFRTRIPRAAGRFVARPRLSDMAGTGLSQAPDDVVLITGPPGSGKTTLAAEWARSVPRASWISLSDGDDARSVWATILATIPAIDLRLPPSRQPDLEFVAAFVRAAEELRDPVWLFLDEIEHVSDPVLLSSMNLLVRFPPAPLRLVLAGRFEPPLGLARLRIDGRLREIRFADLQFTQVEAAELLAGHSLSLDAAALGDLMALTEGWAAGLRLAALALERTDNRSALLADLAGDGHAVADYLVGELFARQPPREHEFMLYTSVCDELTPELASELSGLDDAGEILERFCRTNALTERSTGTEETYRYHGLLRGYLSAELRRTRGVAAEAQLHSAAAGWYASHHDLRRGIAHAAAARDVSQLSELLDEAGPSLWLDGGIDALRSILDAVPLELATHPTVQLIAAAVALNRGDLPDADSVLEAVDTDDPWQAAVHAMLRLRRSRLDGQLDDTLADLDAGVHACGDPDVDELTSLTRGGTRLLLGAADEAEPDLRHALARATARGHGEAALHCLTGLAAAAAMRDDLDAASSRAAAAIDFAVAHDRERSTSCAYAYLVAGYVAYLRLDRDQTARYAGLTRSLLYGVQDPPGRFAATAFSAAVGFDHDLCSGTATLSDLRSHPAAIRREWMGSALLEPMSVVFAAGAQERMSLWVGETGWAADAVRHAAGRLGDAGDVRVLKAALDVHRGRVDAARRSLAAVLSGSAHCVSAISALEAWLLEALIADLGGDERRAYRALTEAVRRAESLTVRRAFHDGGRRVRDLLSRHIGRFGRLEPFVATLLARCPCPVLGPAERLSDREFEVLTELPSMRTSEEIAGDLGVSVNTIKTHQRSIYRKLAVGNRREAIEAGRVLGLL
jgi:LuxR family maltose regulon positive regulatory protein